MFPFSFTEYARATGADQAEGRLAQGIISYSREGGLPEPLLKGVDRTEYIRALLNSLVYKDVVRRFRIRATGRIDDLVRYLLSNYATEYSLSTLAEVTACRSPHTVEKYLTYLEQAFLFFRISRFSYKVRQQATANKKVYCIDNGFIAAGGFAASPNTGRLMENLVAIRLHRQVLEQGSELYYWKNPEQEEVDFVVKQGPHISQLIQVCWDLSNHKTRDREIRALLKAGRDLHCENLFILSEKQESVESAEWFGIKGIVRYVPLHKWLTESNDQALSTGSTSGDNGTYHTAQSTTPH
jgi:predicted AAA+ superfamily ATPase